MFSRIGIRNVNPVVSPHRLYLFRSLLVSLMCLLLPVLVFASDVPRIENGATPTQGITTLNLTEKWRVGGDDEDIIFGVVNRVLTDDQNNIYLLDSQLAEVKVFSADGELINTLGREGDGPGEFRRPADMCFLPDGTLGVVQPFPGSVVKLDLDNTPAGTWTLGDPTSGGFIQLNALRQHGGNIVAGGTIQHVDQSIGQISRESFICSLDEEGMRKTDFITSEVVLDLQQLRLDEMELIDSAARRYDVGPDGRVITAIPRYGYEISIFTPDGALERVVTREYKSWKRDERASGIWQRIFESIRDQQVPGAPITIEDREPDVESLRVAPDGSIWILTSRAMWDAPADAFTLYDVFSPDGRFEKQVRIVCEGDPREDFLIFAGNDLVFMVTGFWDAALARFGGAGATIDDDDPEPMSVVCFQIES